MLSSTQPPQLPSSRHLSRHNLPFQCLEDRSGRFLMQLSQSSDRANRLSFQLTTAVQYLQSHALGLIEVGCNQVLLGTGQLTEVGQEFGSVSDGPPGRSSTIALKVPEYI